MQTSMHKTRNRSRPPGSFTDRLQRFADHTRGAARRMPAGRARDALMKKAKLTENVMDFCEILALRK